MKDMRGKKVLVLGLGLSGEAAAALLLRRGADAAVWDEERGGKSSARAAGLRARGVSLRLGKTAGWRRGDRFDLAVASPGISLSHPWLKEARRRGVPVIGELELAARCLDLPLIAVTGTNGKSTAVALLARMLADGGKRCALAGNIGYPLSRAALRPGGAEAVVVEVSSFQLETIESFRPRIAVFLDFSPDHLDRYPDPRSYLRAKTRLFRAQRPGDWALIAPGLPARVRAAVPRGVRIASWGRRGGLVYAEGGWLKGRRGARTLRICPIARVPLPGKHNLNNVMAAAAAALLRGVSASSLSRTIESFRGLPHRLERVGVLRGVEYYNDSKATNPGAAIAALKSFSRPIVWIAGGRDKNFDFRTLREAAGEKVRLAILVGETREKIRLALRGAVPCLKVSGFLEAVDRAVSLARPGEIVLLAPACASFDMFANYEERGTTFARILRAKGVKR